MRPALDGLRKTRPAGPIPLHARKTRQGGLESRGAARVCGGYSREWRGEVPAPPRSSAARSGKPMAACGMAAARSRRSMARGSAAAAVIISNDFVQGVDENADRND